MSLVMKSTSKPRCPPRQHLFQYQLLVNECLPTKLCLMQMRKNYQCIEADACVQKCERERERAKVREHWFCCGNRNSFFPELLSLCCSNSDWWNERCIENYPIAVVVVAVAVVAVAAVASFASFWHWSLIGRKKWVPLPLLQITKTRGLFE